VDNTQHGESSINKVIWFWFWYCQGQGASQFTFFRLLFHTQGKSKLKEEPT